MLTCSGQGYASVERVRRVCRRCRRGRTRRMAGKTIVVGYDHSEPAQAALRWAVEQAECSASELLLVYAASTVVDWELAALQFDTDPLRRRIEHSLEHEWTEPLRTRGVAYRTKFVLGRPAEQRMAAGR